MASSVEIANRALTKIGEARITSITDGATKQGRDLNSMFAIVRDNELRDHRWSFAITRAVLAASVTAPAYGYSHQFPLPSDFLRLLMVGDILPGPDLSDYRNGADTQDWTIEGRNILRNGTGPLYIRYIKQVPDTTQWDSSFTEAFACRLAAELCESLTQSAQKRQLAWNEYEMAITKARRAGAIELPPTPIADDTWVLTRVRN